MLATVIVLPAMLLALWMVLQFALAQHVRHGAQTAAQDAALAGASHSGDPAAVAQSIMASLGSAASNVQVSVSTSATWVTVTVTADVKQIVPMSMTVTETASAPIEAFTPEDERP